MKGFFHRILLIDATRRTFSVETFSDADARMHLGGKGLGTALLLAKNPAGVDPLSAGNHIVFSLGPASDSPVYGSCRYAVLAKSPLTGFLGHSYSGGKLAIPMSRTGYDAMAIHGASEKPVWIEISDRDVQFHDASSLWGKDTYEAEDAIKSALPPGEESGVVVIGPAGENLVRFAVIENDRWRSAGRSGMGAVLGAKRIKAVAFHGTQVRPFADPDGLKTYARETLNQFREHPATTAYRNNGTPMMVALLNTAGGFPTQYWSAGHKEGWEKIGADAMKSRCGAKPRACRTCFMACGKLIEVAEGRHRGLQIEGPEYETLYAFGGLCMIDSIEEIAWLNDLCDRLGIDTISAGNLVALAMEASKRGIISETISYGDADHAGRIIAQIAAKTGIGALLAEGIRSAAEALGLSDIAVHVKGMEPAGYDPRSLNGMALAYAVSDRGACHLRSTFYKAELAGMIPRKQVEGKAELFVDFEDRCTLHDCLVSCRFYRDFYTWEALSRIVALTTGVQMEKADLQLLASRVANLARAFNIREGLTAADDTLPARMFREPLENGDRILPADLDRMKSDYYRLRGWKEDGTL
ncbi:aldehyde ferredoxin oxidoreductase family protein [Desulfatirhabdium butyrativorans]|uniref:aldehyde ferredoxin oxidoreductase family protein n=1 Tax=Desulfatirhabdium butyrativorans TaxID=340467 RepID=UPI000424FF08|nr:aldehyde ferredoxin oxidoreductase family protein [Desulfatirhabdium butyrativorans]